MQDQSNNRMLIGNVKAVLVALGICSIFSTPPRPFSLALIVLAWLFLYLVNFNEPAP